MEQEYITGIIGLVTTFSAYFFGMRKSKADSKSIEVDNDKEILSTYKTELEFFSKQLELCRTEIKELREEVSTLLDSACYNSDCASRIK